MNKYFKFRFYALPFLLLLSAFLSGQDLISYEFQVERSRNYMTANYGPLMENGVRLYSITYLTRDIHGMPDTASGLVVVPVRDPDLLYPRVVFQHGTVSDRNDVPSKLRGGYQLAEVFGGIGFVTIAPDFLGLGTSRGVHPYVHADSEAWASVDMLFALNELMEILDRKLNEQVFVTGYSQGGHAAAALHRSLEQDYQGIFDVTAAAPMSGPYSISGVMFDLMLGDEPYNFAAYLPHTLIGYNEVYGLYDDIVEVVFQDAYIPVIRMFQAEQINLSQLNNSLLSMLMQNTGSTVVRNLMREEFIKEMEDENHPARMALRDNDVYDWTPVAPTRLLYCRADDQVPYQNAIKADSIMGKNGAPDIQAWDMDSNADHGQCVQPATIASVLFFLSFRELNTSVSNFVEADRLKIYPNPASDALFLENVSMGAAVNIYDMRGIAVKRLLWSNLPIDISSLTPGTYILQVEDKKSGYTSRTWVKS